MSKLSKSDILKMIDDYVEEERTCREKNDKKRERKNEYAERKRERKNEYAERKRRREEEYAERKRRREEEYEERRRKREEEYEERRRRREEEYEERKREIEKEYEERKRESEEFYKQYRRETHEYNYKYVYPIAAKLYQSSNPTELSDAVLEFAAKGGYIHDNGIDDNVDEGYKEYFNYLKYGIKPYQQEEVKEEPIMIEDNYNNYNYETPYSNEYEPYFSNNYEYTTPYSFEYEPYFSNNNYSITFDHEVDTSNSIQMIEEMYNEEPVEEESCDINELISIVDILTNKISKVKKSIIHYISNYRPIYNQYTDTIEAVLIE